MYMPIDFNEKRAIYFPQGDLMFSYYFNRVTEILRDSSTEDISNINDAIEIYQCKLIYNNNIEYFSDTLPALPPKSIDKLFDTACRMAINTLKNQRLLEIFNEIELQYIEQFWEFVFFLNFWKIILEEDMQNFLKNHPNQIPKLIENKEVSNKYDKVLSKAMETNFKISAECIIRVFAIDINEKIFLPKSLTNTKIDHIMLNYLGGKLPEVNIKFVEALFNWPTCSKYNPSPEVRIAAKKLTNL